MTPGAKQTESPLNEQCFTAVVVASRGSGDNPFCAVLGLNNSKVTNPYGLGPLCLRLGTGFLLVKSEDDRLWLCSHGDLIEDVKTLEAQQ